jgi:predicted MFS family arabinose efflux permease
LIIITLWLKIPHNGHGEKGKQEKMEFREVFTLIKADSAVLVGLINMGLITLFLGGINLLVLEFSEVQQSPEAMGLIYTVEGTSILVGGLLAKRCIGGKNLVVVSTWLLFLFAVSEFGMSFAENRYLVLSSFVLFGLTVAFFFPVTTTIFQKRLPEHTHGRFFSFRSMIDRTLFFIAIGTTGACLDLMGISWYLVMIGCFTLLSAAVTLMYGKKHALVVRQSDEQAPVRTA